MASLRPLSHGLGWLNGGFALGLGRLRLLSGLMAEPKSAAAEQAGKERPRSVKGETWLGDLDSNQGCSGQSREFYR